MSAPPRPLVARWRDWAGMSSEHLVLTQADDVVTADSVIIGGGAAPFALRYRIVCDRAWRARSCEIELVGSARPLRLVAGGDGGWSDGAGRELPQLRGAIDLDLSATPFTNSLPIRRLGLRPGQAAEINAVYVRIPELAVAADPQRYTCLDGPALDGAGRYRYESLDSDFTREIETDADGLVTLYPGLFRRIS
jgi:hypothetical protein